MPNKSNGRGDNEGHKTRSTDQKAGRQNTSGSSSSGAQKQTTGKAGKTETGRGSQKSQQSGRESGMGMDEE